MNYEIIQPGLRVVDLGSRPGHLCIALAMMGAQAYGIDASLRAVNGSNI